MLFLLSLLSGLSFSHMVYNFGHDLVVSDDIFHKKPMRLALVDSFLFASAETLWISVYWTKLYVNLFLWGPGSLR